MAHKRIRWAPVAIADLESICNFISRDSEYYAAIFAKRIISIIENVPDFPLTGRIVPEYENKNIRERIYKNYRIVYRINNDFIEIITIINSSKPLNDL